METAVSRIAERHRLEAETLAIQTQSQHSPPPSPKRGSTSSQTFLDRSSRLALPSTGTERGEILGPTRDLLISGSGKVVGAVKKPFKGLESLVFGGESGGESPPPERQDETRRSRVVSREQGSGESEEEVAVRLANAEIERAEHAEREQRGKTLEMLSQMFPGNQPSLPPIHGKLS